MHRLRSFGREQRGIWGRLLALLSAVAAPLSAGWCAAAPPRDNWCTVPRDVAATSRDLLVKRLEPLLNRQPQPMDRLYLAGYLPHQGRHDESAAAVHELEDMRGAALAWRAGAGPAYFTMAKRYLLAWAATYRPTLQPIDETNFDTLIDAYAILKPELGADDRARVGDWLRGWGQDYIDAMEGAQRRGNHTGGWVNNWQSHRIKIVTMIAAATEDDNLFAAARTFFKTHVLENIEPDGEVTDFVERDALHYVVYDLEPLLQAALAARSRGENWYDSGMVEDRSLKQAVAWLVPYVTGAKTHEEFVKSTVAFDHERAAAGLKEYAGQYDPRHAAKLYWLAAEFEPSYRALAERLHAPAPDFIALCGQ